jgi:hypothetical protein
MLVGRIDKHKNVKHQRRAQNARHFTEASNIAGITTAIALEMTVL